jgi:hypothetical protein
MAEPLKLEILLLVALWSESLNRGSDAAFGGETRWVA